MAGRLEDVNGVGHRLRADADAAPLSAKASHLKVSILICTRNRAAKLPHTLEAIRALEVPAGAEYELIVVNNGSTDATAQICERYRECFGGRLRTIFLAEPGLGRARNAALAVATGEIIAFTDDDVVPQADWLLVICREFAADPELSLISGRVELADPLDLPISIRRSTGRAEFTSLGDAFSLLIGCNFAFRRGLLGRIGLFDPDFGAGARFPSSEDSDFYYRAWRAGKRLVYVPSMFVQHDHGRRFPEAWVKITRNYIIGRGAFYAKHSLRRDKTVIKEMYWELLKGWRGLFDRDNDLGWNHLRWLLNGILRYSLMRFGRLFTLAWVQPGSSDRR